MKITWKIPGSSNVSNKNIMHALFYQETIENAHEQIVSHLVQPFLTSRDRYEMLVFYFDQFCGESPNWITVTYSDYSRFTTVSCELVWMVKCLETWGRRWRVNRRGVIDDRLCLCQRRSNQHLQQDAIQVPVRRLWSLTSAVADMRVQI